jgi:hypothetical protein
MNRPDAPADPPAAEGGATTAGQGTPAPVDVGVDRRSLTTIALALAGPVIWSVHFMVVYLVVEAGCTGDGRGLDVFDPPVPTVTTHLATAVAVAACLACAGLAYRRWRQEQQAASVGGEADESAGTLPFVAFLLCLLGVITVLFVGLPALVLPACGP